MKSVSASICDNNIQESLSEFTALYHTECRTALFCSVLEERLYYLKQKKYRYLFLPEAGTSFSRYRAHLQGESAVKWPVQDVLAVAWSCPYDYLAGVAWHSCNSVDPHCPRHRFDVSKFFNFFLSNFTFLLWHKGERHGTTWHVLLCPGEEVACIFNDHFLLSYSFISHFLNRPSHSITWSVPMPSLKVVPRCCGTKELLTVAYNIEDGFIMVLGHWAICVIVDGLEAWQCFFLAMFILCLVAASS